MSELPLNNCENCGGEVKRLITGGSGIIFKGSGFYLTDYKNSKESTENNINVKENKNENSNPSEKEKNKEMVNKSNQKKEK
jgi:predicted nucleic acid-binding Zn ribbon protein